MQTFISRKPGGVERWALPIFLGLFLLLLAASWVIRCPDVIVARGKLRAGSLPADPCNNHYFLQVNLAQSNLQKIDTGMTVNVRFDAYPFQEMGYVEGKLSFVSDIASDSGIQAIIRFDKGLQTTNHKTIPYKVGLTADALLIAGDMRLLQRIYNNVTQFSTTGQ